MFSPKLSVDTQRSESASICDSGCVASFPDAGSLPLFSVFEIIKLVCVCSIVVFVSRICKWDNKKDISIGYHLGYQWIKQDILYGYLN